MRKLDYLRKTFNKIEDESWIYYITLPDAFKAKGEKYKPTCIPLLDTQLRCIGVSVEHSVGEYVWGESFILRRWD